MHMKKVVLLTIAAGAIGGLSAAGIAVASDGPSPQGSSPSVEAPPDKVLPDRIAVSGPDGNWAGYADRKVLDAVPNFAASPNDPESAMNAYLHELVPVTETVDPGSSLVGYVVRNYGFVDLPTTQSPGFDIDTLLAQSSAQEQQLQQQWKESQGTQ